MSCKHHDNHTRPAALGNITGLVAAVLLAFVVVVPPNSADAEVLQMEYSERTRILDGAVCLTARNGLPARAAVMSEAQRAAASVDEVCLFRADLLIEAGAGAKARTIEVGEREAMLFGREQEICLDARWQLRDGEKIVEVLGIGYRCFPNTDYQRIEEKDHPPPLRRSEVVSYLQQPAYAAILGMPFLSGE